MLFIFTKPYTFFSFHFLLPYWRTFITISLFLLAFIFCLHPWAFKLKDVFCNHGYNWSNIPKGQWWVFEITLSTRRVLEAFVVFAWIWKTEKMFPFHVVAQTLGAFTFKLISTESDQIVFALHSLDVVCVYTPMQLMWCTYTAHSAAKDDISTGQQQAESKSTAAALVKYPALQRKGLIDDKCSQSDHHAEIWFLFFL